MTALSHWVVTTSIPQPVSDHRTFHARNATCILIAQGVRLIASREKPLMPRALSSTNETQSRHIIPLNTLFAPFGDAFNSQSRMLLIGIIRRSFSSVLLPISLGQLVKTPYYRVSVKRIDNIIRRASGAKVIREIRTLYQCFVSLKFIH